MQSQANSNVASKHQPLVISEQGFDFSSLPDGTPLRVSPTLIDDLSVGGNHRRKTTRKEEFKESIRTKGIIQSLSVRPSVANPTRLELCAGYGRRDAALEFCLPDVPVILNHATDTEALAIMLNENRHRQNVSIVDEADLAQNYLSLHDGNYKSAAILLGLSESTFRERLQIKRCSDTVLDALADESNRFSLGHALILSTFDEPTQEKTLGAILADPDTYTVKELKLRAGQRQLPLSKAPFNTSECFNCKHNTGEQLDLLNLEDTEAKCSFVSCFNKKAQEWVQSERKAELEEKYGKVILWEVKPEQDRRTVSAKEVGEKQFTDGCMNCENKCTIVDDRPMRWGQYQEDQCIDTDCYNTCLSDHKKAVQQQIEKETAKKKAALKAVQQEEAKQSVVQAQPKAQDQTNELVDETDQEPELENQDNAPVKRKTSSAVMEDYRTLLRATSANAVISDPQFRMAVALASICDVSGYKVPANEFETKSMLYSFNDKVLAYMTLDLKTIQREMGLAVAYHATESEKQNYNNTDLMISVLKAKDGGDSIAKEAWMPTKQRLGRYNIGQLEQMCKDSGFITAYNLANTKNDFSKLLKNRKDDIVDGIIGFNFDWTHFAPDDFLALVS